MAEKLQFNGSFDGANEAFPELRWRLTRGGNGFIYDENGNRVPVAKGQWILKVGKRFEVHDDEPEEVRGRPVHEAEVEEEPKKKVEKKSESKDSENK